MFIACLKSDIKQMELNFRNMMPGLVLILCSCFCLSDAARILLVPVDHIGHVNFMALTARGLQQNGHDAYVMTTYRHEALLKKLGAKHLLFEFESQMNNFTLISNALFNTEENIILRSISMAMKITDSIVEMCDLMFNDEKWMKKIEDMEFDIAIVDGVDVYRCAYIYPHRLNIPYVTLTARHDPWSAGVPAMPFVEGFLGLVEITEESTLLDRIKSFGVFSLTYLMSPPSQYKDSQIKQWAPNRPETTYDQLFKSSGVFMVNSDLFCLDTPRVTAPHYHFVGAAGAHTPDPLPTDFQQIVDNAKNGFVLVSFGSAIKKVPLEVIERFLAVFKLSKYTYIMRYDGPMPVDIPANVYLKKWLPQNDLLGNKNIKLFITHSGNNGQLETVYHGVPVVSVPFAGDQYYNAKRFEHRGYGLIIDVWTFTTDELLNAINEVIDNPKYAQTIKQCSNIQKEFPSAPEQINFWVNFVLKYGGDHLKPKYMNMPLYKIFGFDVLGTLVFVISIVLYLLVKFCKMCCKRCCRKTNQDKTKKE